MFSEREQAQFEHIQYVHNRLLALKSSRREHLAVFGLVAGLVYWGTELIAVAVALGWIATMIRGAADDLKRTYLLTEFNRAMCDFEGDLEEMRLKLGIDGAIERAITLPFWRKWL